MFRIYKTRKIKIKQGKCIVCNKFTLKKIFNYDRHSEVIYRPDDKYRFDQFYKIV